MISCGQKGPGSVLSVITAQGLTNGISILGASGHLIPRRLYPRGLSRWSLGFSNYLSSPFTLKHSPMEAVPFARVPTSCLTPVLACLLPPLPPCGFLGLVHPKRSLCASGVPVVSPCLKSEEHMPGLVGPAHRAGGRIGFLRTL